MMLIKTLTPGAVERRKSRRPDELGIRQKNDTPQQPKFLV